MILPLECLRILQTWVEGAGRWTLVRIDLGGGQSGQILPAPYLGYHRFFYSTPFRTSAGALIQTYLVGADEEFGTTLSFSPALTGPVSGNLIAFGVL